LAQDLEDMAAALGPCIQEEHAMVGQRHVTRHRHVAPADQSRIRDGTVGRATPWMSVVLSASGKGISSRIVVRGRASIDWPATRGPIMWMMILMRPATDFAWPLHAGGIAPVRSGANHRVLIGFAVEEVDGAYVRLQGLEMAWVQELTTQLQHIPFTLAMSN